MHKINNSTLTKYVNFSGNHVACTTDRNDQSETYMPHCHVNHSINTVPTFSCPVLESASATIEDVESEINVSKCAYDNIKYNLTSFNVSITDNVNQLTCTVRYTAVGNSATIYLEEKFVVYYDVNNTQTKQDNTEGSAADSNPRGKYDIFQLEFNLVRFPSVKFI